jgi:dCTP deaminase
MSFWSTEKLRSKHGEFVELIEPWDEKRVQHGAYELSLGPEAFITTKGTKRRLDVAKNQQIVIPPGQFGLLLTEETVAIPHDAIGFISIKFSIKQRGLVNVSGFHVDPGFKGRLKFAVYNAASQNVVLSYGSPVFMIWFSDLTGVSKDMYDGEHANQVEITAEDVMKIQGNVASPGALKRQIDRLRNEVRVIEILLLAILAVVGAFGKSCIERSAQSPPPASSSPSNNILPSGGAPSTPTTATTPGSP